MPLYEEEYLDSKGDNSHALECSNLSGHDNIPVVDDSIGIDTSQQSKIVVPGEAHVEIDETIEDPRRLFCGMLSKHYTEATLSEVSIYPFTHLLYFL